jgi:ATP-binding cassette, subfamily C, bacterial
MYPVVQQHNEEDCGAASLATIAKYYGQTFPISHVRNAVGTGQLGTTLLGLKQGAEVLGFNARGVKATENLIESIYQLPLPAIIHWKGYHWVVLYGKHGKKYVVADPGIGIRYLTKKEIEEAWANGIMLLLEPDALLFVKQPKDQINGVDRFLTRIRLHYKILIQAFITNLILGLISLASPFLLQVLTDDVLVRGDANLLTGVVIAVGITNLISSLLKLVQANLVAHFSQRLELGLILDFVRKILRLPLSYYETHRSGETTSRLRDIYEINYLVSQIFTTLPSQFCVAVFSIGFMLLYSTKLTFVAVLLSTFIILSSALFFPALQQKNRTTMAIGADNQGILIEIFKGALTLKTINAELFFWEDLQSRYGRLANSMLRTLQLGIINSTFSGFISSTGSVLLLWYGSSLVINKELSIGQLLAFNSMNISLLNFMETVAGFLDEFSRTKVAFQRLLEVIDAAPEDNGSLQKPCVKLPDNSSIKIEKLDFYHPGRPELLKDFSLLIPGGKVIAIIGQSGCGKSTLAKLISGLHRPKSGNICIDSYSLQDLSSDCLHQQVMLVPQEAHFWSRSILENFRLSSPQSTFEEIVKACQITGADDFISKLPDKYQMVLGEFGANISGGQRQRIALARAMIKNPSILILDESTSGLDPISEAQILDQILLQRYLKTTILISHRPKVINRADYVILLEEGIVKVQGCLDSLKQNLDVNTASYLVL